ncbi:hypothetical protein J437_LFUL001995 [Ladona fulva]|uniref:LIM zinc-binding domain-containing protein n=1 Tax=Ladona fulva TaxID=123851 RepID=A0A8K0JW95_LADFU|nr:hypothetical protein J437_LFUL001995 [Ladona fulva]
MEKVEAGGKILHKSCFRCLQCNCILRMESYTMNNGNLYCMTHFKQLFIAKGNYDDGFGAGQNKTKWTSSLKKQQKKDGSPKENGTFGKDNFFDEDSFYTRDID